MNFVDNIDFLPAGRGKCPDRFLQRPDFFNASIGAASISYTSREDPESDFKTVSAFIAGVAVMGMFCSSPPWRGFLHARLSCTPRAGEEVSVCEAALLKRALAVVVETCFCPTTSEKVCGLHCL